MGGLLGREFESPHLHCRYSMAEKVDVRILKTKERLKRALLDLLRTKPVSDISVSEICKKGEVNRNTFYCHYDSVADLLSEVEGTFLEEISSSIRISGETIESVSDLVYLILRVAKANRDLCTLLFSENGDKKFIATLLSFAKPSAVENWSEVLNMSRRDAEMLYSFITGGAVSVIERWVVDGFQENEKQIAEKLNLIILGAQQALVQ